MRTITPTVTLPSELVDDIVDAFERMDCMFWACEGPEVAPVDMKTCYVCRTLHDLRKALS